MITTGSETCQITANWNKKPLTKSKDFLENVGSKFLCDIISPLLPGQYDFPCFTMSISRLDYYHW